MTSGLIKGIIFAGVAFIIMGISLTFGPTMLTGFESMRTATNEASYTALDTVIKFGPTLILLGFIISVGIVGFLGIKMFSKRGD